MYKYVHGSIASAKLCIRGPSQIKNYSIFYDTLHIQKAELCRSDVNENGSICCPKDKETTILKSLSSSNTDVAGLLKTVYVWVNATGAKA